MFREEIIEIQSRDFWFKIVDFLQQNWALIDLGKDAKAKVFFLGDTSGVFDEMTFPTLADAQKGLFFNGFKRFSEDTEAQKFIAIPQPPFWKSQHPNGPIYSSGRFWRS